uniref:Uncharacterized protein n=1 Tax=Anguilla anguilla TaxID=7936 RepID=A0A0E9P5Y6_ANGAN
MCKLTGINGCPRGILIVGFCGRTGVRIMTVQSFRR